MNGVIYCYWRGEHTSKIVKLKDLMSWIMS